MLEYQREFIKFLIDNKVLTFGSFKLKSGRQSPYFFNAGLINSGDTLSKLGSFYAEAIVNSNLDYNLLFGPAYKGIPLVCAASIALSNKTGDSCPFAFNRKEAKDHGEGGLIVGTPISGRVYIIDDVITAGTAIRESVNLISAKGGIVSGVLVALDRQERGTGSESAVMQVSREFGISVTAIITLDDVIEYITQVGGFEEHLPVILEYRREFGI